MTPCRSFLVPEVLQRSLMDCGPAALMAVLQGFGIPASYDELRARCATSVDGTSLDTLAQVATELGLKTQRVAAARDVLLLPESRLLPALTIVESSSGHFHFLVLWRQLGPFVQVMDPGSGRRWIHRNTLEEMLADFYSCAPADRWRKWAAGGSNRKALKARMAQLRISRSRRDALVELACADPTWRPLATLDSGIRMGAQLEKRGLLRGGEQADRLLSALLARGASVPRHFRWVSEAPSSAELLRTRGPVLLHFVGPTPEVAATARQASYARSTKPEAAEPTQRTIPSGQSSVAWSGTEMRVAVTRELSRSTLRPLRILWLLLKHDAGAGLVVVVLAVVLSALVVPLEAFSLQALLHVEQVVSQAYQRAAGLLAAALLVAFGLASDWWAGCAVAGLARRLEGRVRVAFLWQLPRLDDHYLLSRPHSDMAGRGNALHVVRAAPAIWASFLRESLGLGTTAFALVWLFPSAFWLVLGIGVLSVFVARLAHGSLAERNTKLATLEAGLDKFYLDALLGATAVSAHGAQGAMNAAYEERLTEWAREARGVSASEAWLQGVQSLFGAGLTAALVLSFVWHGLQPSQLLLVAFLASRVPESARRLVLGQAALRSLQGLALRIVAPLAAPVDTTERGDAEDSDGQRGVELVLRGVDCEREGQLVLDDIDLAVAPGEHVAVVGASGSGKSTLLGLLLGWAHGAKGNVRLDGEPATPERLAQLRSQTAWVDPSVQLWGRSLFENLAFGSEERVEAGLTEALHSTDLLEVQEVLPEGLQTSLGEDGARISGGQGQRVRLGRAWLRKEARLVLLDEPFRGLERGRRRELLRRAREHWKHATLLFVSHDVQDALEFERVVVLRDGRIVEDGSPRELLKREHNAYSELVRADKALQREVWSAERWRRVFVGKQRLVRALSSTSGGAPPREATRAR